MSEGRHINIPIFIPHRGCTHTCVFCDQKKISGASSQTLDSVKKLIDESFSTIGTEDNVEIAFFGGSFTGIPEAEMLSFLNLAKPYIQDGRVQGIRLSTRPDNIDLHILGILQEYGVTAIELGVQSLDEEILKQSLRGHTAEDVTIACSLIKGTGIQLGIQTMLGLPGDSIDKALETAHGVLKLKPDMVRIYPVVVLEGTFLESMYKSGQYMPLSLDEAVKWCAQIMPLYRKAGITILRTGLQASESLEGSVIAGPYHPAFGELVESHIIYSKLVEQLDSLQPFQDKRIIIETRPDMVSKLVGQKKANIIALKTKYQLNEIIIQTNLQHGEFEIKKLNT